MDQLRPAIATQLCARGARPGVPRPALIIVALLAGLSAACTQSVALQNTYDSDEALARAVLARVAADDREALMTLAITRDEFEAIVWPTLPVSRPEVGMPMSYVWQDTFTKSRAYLAQTLEGLGGRRFELVRVESHGDTTEHAAYTLSRETVLIVRDQDGRERSLRVFGSIIRQGGRSKVYSFIVG